MKKNHAFLKTFAFGACLAFCTQKAEAQTMDKVRQATNVEVLQTLAQTYKTEAINQKEIAWKTADKNGWAKRITSPNGEVIELMGLDEFGSPLYYTTDSNLRAAQTISTNKLWTGGSLGLSLTGQGMVTADGYARLGEWDGGAARTEHQEFSANGGSTVVQRDGASGFSNHATHVAGTMVGFGVRADAKGMSFKAQLDAHDWDNDAGEMAIAASNGMLISNHSYGTVTGWSWTGNSWVWNGNSALSTSEDFKFGQYDTRARDWDNIAFNAPYYLICKSAGNDRGDGPNEGVRLNDGGEEGYDCISTYSTAKNILTVGAVNGLQNGYANANGVIMSDFSGWGPTDDGRIKPDVCGNGVGVTSATAASNTSYDTYNGTSMATPNVSGSLLLLQQHYQNLFGAGNFMRSATLKGLTIHTADEAGTSAGPDYRFGWGLVNVATAATAITNAKNGTGSFMFDKILTNNTPNTFEITSNGQPLRATICWTDRAGTPVSPAVNDSPTRMLVQDLDARITYAGNTHQPWILDPANPSFAATRGDNNRDNVEQILISPTVNTGVYTLTINHKGALQGGSQRYSLWITGATNVADVSATPLMRFTTTAAALNEGATTGVTSCRKYQDVNVTLQITKPYVGTAQVTLQPTGTASAISDYSIISPTTFSFTGTTMNQNVTVRVFDDRTPESAENIVLAYTISGNSNVMAGDANQTFTINLQDEDTNPTAIATALGSATEYVAPNSTTHFYTVDGKLIGTIENQSNTDCDCTTLAVDGTGTSTIPYINTAREAYTTQKTHKITWGNAVTNLAYRLTLYYTEAEVKGWEIETTRTRNQMTLLGSLNAIDTPISTAQYASSPLATNILSNEAVAIRGNFTRANTGFAGCLNELARGPLSLERNNIAQAITLYPNPTTGKIFLRVENQNISSEAVWRLLDANGRQVATWVGKAEDIEKQLNLQLQKSTKGLYLLHLQDDTKYFTGKIVKQ